MIREHLFHVFCHWILPQKIDAFLHVKPFCVFEENVLKGLFVHG